MPQEGMAALQLCNPVSSLLVHESQILYWHCGWETPEEILLPAQVLCHCPGASWMVGQGCFLNTGIQVTILNYAATLSSYLKSQSSQAKSPVIGENGVSHLFLKKGDEDCRSYPPVSLTTVHGKIMVYRSSQKTHQNIWKMERWLRTANMSCSFSKGKQYQTNRVALDDGVTALVDKG